MIIAQQHTLATRYDILTFQYKFKFLKAHNQPLKDFHMPILLRTTTETTFCYPITRITYSCNTTTWPLCLLLRSGDNTKCRTFCEQLLNSFFHSPRALSRLGHTTKIQRRIDEEFSSHILRPFLHQSPLNTQQQHNYTLPRAEWQYFNAHRINKVRSSPVLGITSNLRQGVVHFCL